jgi:hypothetical protein
MSDDFLELGAVIFTDLAFKKVGVELLAEGVVEKIGFDVLFIVLGSGADN